MTVFRKGGVLERNEKWLISGNILEVVNIYLYHGFTFTMAMNANDASKQLTVQREQSLFQLLRAYTHLWQMYRQNNLKQFTL